MLRVALTGGIATGKSYCLDRFSRLGVPVVDADVLARDALAPGTPGLARVRTRFGPDVFETSDALDRAAMARLVFADARARADLEAIVHPLVYQRIRDWFDALEAPEAQGPGPQAQVAIADVPLLYETGHEGDFDRVVVAACSREQQIERLMARGLSAGDAAARLAAQLPIDDKRRRADEVIDTSGTLEETDRQVASVLARLSGPTQP